MKALIDALNESNSLLASILHEQRPREEIEAQIHDNRTAVNEALSLPAATLREISDAIDQYVMVETSMADNSERLQAKAELLQLISGYKAASMQEVEEAIDAFELASVEAAYDVMSDAKLEAVRTAKTILRAAISRHAGEGWRPITDAQRDGELWIVSDGIYSVPATYFAMPGENCWYEYGRGPADGKESYGLNPTLYQPFPKAQQ